MTTKEDNADANAGNELTDELVENWRRILIRMFGPYALHMTREEILTFRNKMQELADRTEETL